MYAIQPFFVVAIPDGATPPAEPHKSGIGRWNGLVEPIALVPCHGTELEERALEACLHYRQECVLAVDAAGLGFLVGRRGEQTPVGRWAEADADAKDYTEVDGRRFACR